MRSDRDYVMDVLDAISNKLKEKHPGVPWKAIAGMRDKLIHAYFGVDLEVVWLTVKKDISKIKPVFENLFKKVGGDSNV